MQGGSPGPNWYEMVGLPLSSAGLFFQIVPVPSSINPGLDTHSSRTEYHSVDTSYHGWGPEVNVGSFWDRPTRAGLFSPLLRSAVLAHPEHSSSNWRYHLFSSTVFNRPIGFGGSDVMGRNAGLFIVHGYLSTIGVAVKDSSQHDKRYKEETAFDGLFLVIN